jgi:thioredoxin-like negative regulator of GroEL
MSLIQTLKRTGEGKSHNAEILERIMDPTHKDHVSHLSKGAKQSAKQLGFPSAQDKVVKKETVNPFIRSAADKIDRARDSDEDSVFSDFSDDDETLARIRQKRMKVVQKVFSRRQEFLGLGHGVYSEVSQDDFLGAVTGSKYVVCHFYHEEFTRCKIMDKHLSLLAPKHLPTRMIKIDANKAPFFVSKLVIKTLPTIVLFRDGKAIDRVTGFDDMGGLDNFPTSSLETRFMMAGMCISNEEAEAEKDEATDRATSKIRDGNVGGGGFTS